MFNSMDADLRPLDSCCLYTTITTLKKKDLGEIEKKKIEKYSQCIHYNCVQLFICVSLCVDYICVLLHVIAYLIVRNCVGLIIYAWQI